MEMIIGSSLCACQPLSWEFVVDLNLPCSPRYNGNTNNNNNNNNNNGDDPIVAGMMQRHECFPPLLEPGVVDDVNFDPTQGIESIYVLELDQDLETISQYNVPSPNGPDEPFQTGDFFTYESIITTTPSFDTTTLPMGLVLIFAGYNVLGQRITASWSVQFSNSCQPYFENVLEVPPPPRQETNTLLTSIYYSNGPPNPYCPLNEETYDPKDFPSPPPLPVPPSPPCACQPMAWELEICLNSQDCTSCPTPPDAAFESDGIAQQSCVVGTNGANVTDRVMTRIDRMLIMELSQDLISMTQYMVPNGPFFHGDIITYESVQLGQLLSSSSSIPTDLELRQNLPGGIVVAMSGPNRAGETIDASWSLAFTNDCNVFPVVHGDETIVNTIVRNVEDPPESVCPSAATPQPRPTTAPTTGSVPTRKPIPSITPNPTPKPTNKATQKPTNKPNWVAKPPICNDRHDDEDDTDYDRYKKFKYTKGKKSTKGGDYDYDDKGSKESKYGKNDKGYYYLRDLRKRGEQSSKGQNKYLIKKSKNEYYSYYETGKKEHRVYSSIHCSDD